MPKNEYTPPTEKCPAAADGADGRESLRFGMIGLGIMGGALAANALAAGAAVVGYDIDQAAMRRFQALGGSARASAAEVAAADSPVVLTSLPSVDAFEDVLYGPEGLLAAAKPGLIIAEISTLPLDIKLTARDRAAAHGVVVLDAPLSGTGAQAKSGDVIVFMSGDSNAKKRVEPVLLRFARAVHDVGDFGNGSRLKYVANHLVAVHNLAAAEAIVLAEHAGLDLETVLSAVADGAGTSRMFELRGPLIASSDYDNPTARLRVFMKDIEIISSFASSTVAPTPLFDITREYYRRALAAGYGDSDSAAVAELLRGEARDQSV